MCNGTIEEVIRDLSGQGVTIEVGPVVQTGARGSMSSVYFRDPDGNLIEAACYPEESTEARP